MAEIRKQQLEDKTKSFGTTVSYLLGWMKSESRDPACDCHLHLLGSSLDSLRNCKKSVQLLHSYRKKQTINTLKSSSVHESATNGYTAKSDKNYKTQRHYIHCMEINCRAISIKRDC